MPQIKRQDARKIRKAAGKPSDAPSPPIIEEKLPAYARRRLERLMDKNKTAAGLDPAEGRELRDMLSFIDERNLDLLRRALARKQAAERIAELKAEHRRLAEQMGRLMSQIEHLAGA